MSAWIIKRLGRFIIHDVRSWERKRKEGQGKEPGCEVDLTHNNLYPYGHRTTILNVFIKKRFTPNVVLYKLSLLMRTSH